MDHQNETLQVHGKSVGVIWAVDWAWSADNIRKQHGAE